MTTVVKKKSQRHARAGQGTEARSHGTTKAVKTLMTGNGRAEWSARLSRCLRAALTQRNPPQHDCRIEGVLNLVVTARVGDAADDGDKSHRYRAQKQRMCLVRQHELEEDGVQGVAQDGDYAEAQEEEHVEYEESCADASKRCMCRLPRQEEQKRIDDAGALRVRM